MPEALNGLGVAPEELSRHIGWDIGIGELGVLLSEALDAVFVRQTYSRLVIDCNREPGRVDAMPEISDLTVIPGNQDLTLEDRAARVAAIQAPYQDAIAAEIARRDAAGQGTILVSLHSFTPMLQAAGQGVKRPWEVGMLYDRYPAFSQALIAAFRAGGDLTVGDNEPYRMDIIDYTVPRHAYPKGRAYAEIEMRQDLIGSHDGCVEWAGRLTAALVQAAASSTILPRQEEVAGEA